MTILSVQNLGVSFGENTLFKNANINIEEKDKIGLIGANGTGKSTLFNVITGALSAESGQVIKNAECKIGYLEQHAPSDSDENVIEYVLHVFDNLKKIEDELSEISVKLGNESEDIEGLTVLYNTLHDEFETKGGLNYRARAAATLKGLGFDEKFMYHPIKSLSGGEKSKVMLAALLLSSPTLLLLDEPTNHLDINAVTWLENFLNAYNGAFIVISHDRYFLDRVTTKTIELENKKFKMYNGNYTAHLAEKERNKEVEENQYKNQMKEIRRIEGIIETQRRWNRERNIRMAESKQKQLDKLKEALKVPEKTVDDIHFSFKSAIRSGNDVLKIENLFFAYDSPLLNNINLQLFWGDRAFLLGGNGSGKSTLLELILSHLTPKSGTITFGTNVKVSKYDQTQADLDTTKTILEELRDAHPTVTETELRSALAAFLIFGDDVFKPISMLSGGERAKVALLKIILSRPNLLLLDEPTNHLDIISKEALEDALLSYDGTMFVISHDRYFINKLASKVYELSDSNITKFEGNYDFYLEKRTDCIPGTAAKEKKPSSYKEEKAYIAMIRKIKNDIKTSEGKIEELENEISSLEESLAEYASDYVKALEVSKKIEEKKDLLSSLYESWEQLSLLLEETEAGK